MGDLFMVLQFCWRWLCTAITMDDDEIDRGPW